MAGPASHDDDPAAADDPIDDARTEELLEQIAEGWRTTDTPGDGTGAAGAFTLDPLLTDLIGTHSNVVVQVLDMRTFRSVYASPNIVEVCGYSPAEVNDFGVTTFLRNLPPSELALHVRNARVLRKVRRTMPPRTAFHSALVNGSMKRKDGSRLRILAQNFTLDWDDAGAEAHQLYLWRDASHLFKDRSVVWRHRWAPQRRPAVVWSYHTAKNRFVDDDLFTPRELEVLGHIRAGASSREVADHLGISEATVENHRKNAIARLGVKNTESVIEIGAWLRLF